MNRDVTSSSLLDLEEALSRLAAQHRAMQLGQFGSLSQSAPPLRAAAAASGGPYSLNCDNVGLNPFRCGEEHGIALGVCTGNSKDMGCAVASGAAVRVLANTFRTTLLSEADLVPALRRAAIETNDAVLRLQNAPLGSYEFGISAGTRDNLKGIGTSMTVVAAIPSRACGVHIGEGKAYLLRHGVAKKLTMRNVRSNCSLPSTAQGSGARRASGALPSADRS